MKRKSRILAAVLLLGFVIAALFAFAGGRPEQRSSRPLEIVVRDVADVGETVVDFHFPEIPLDVRKPISADGAFELRLSVVCSRRPTYCSVRAGHQEQRVPLSGEPLSGTARIGGDL